MISDDDFVRLLSHELEELDYTFLYWGISAKGRNSSVDSKTMSKILTYTYFQNIYSFRDIETTCRRDINFMWFLARQKAPDHSTIVLLGTYFLADASENLFLQMVRCLTDAGELSKETVFIDGTIREVFTNKYTFVWKKSVSKWEDKMFAKMEDTVALLNLEYINFHILKENRTAELHSIVDYLRDYCLA